MPVDADTGMMGGTASIEFIALSEKGEDRIAMCSCGYAANLEKAQSILYLFSGLLEGPQQRLEIWLR